MSGKGTDSARSTRIMFIVVGSVMILIGIAGRSSFTPLIFDQLFGITSHVEKQISIKIDSGYSATFIFEPRRNLESEGGTIIRKVNNTLLFHAQLGQRVTVTLRFYNPYPDEDFLRITVDQTSWGLKEDFVKLDITQKLQSELGADLHVVRIVPLMKDSENPTVVDVLILVHKTGGSR